MRKSRLKTILWLLLGVLTVVCSTSGLVLARNNWSAEDQSDWLGQSGEASWATSVLFWNEAEVSDENGMEFGAWLADGYMRDHENSNIQAVGYWEVLLWVRPRENEGWSDSGHGDMIGLDKGSSVGNALQGLKLRPEPVTLAVLMISNLMAVSVRIIRKYRPRLR